MELCQRYQIKAADNATIADKVRLVCVFVFVSLSGRMSVSMSACLFVCFLVCLTV